MIGPVVKGLLHIGRKAVLKGAEKFGKLDPNDVLSQSSIDDVVHIIKEILF